MEYGLVVWWLVAYLALLAVGLPLASALFPRFPDRGATFALPVALALVWVVVYLAGHVSLFWGTYAGLAVLFLVALALVYRGVAFDRRRYAEAAGVFTLAFLFLVAVRAVDAGVHPVMGEKFLDFGMLKSVLRADQLPPEDMWFAGRPVKYYYGGHLIAAILTRITGTAPRFGYNLALAGFYAMLVTAAYGLAGAVGASRGVSRLRAGAFGAFFVGFASNLAPIVRALSKGVGTITPGGEQQFWYWRASRVIGGTINEFPLFAWFNGDLHAHMMSTAFVLLAAALLFAYYRTPAASVTRRRLLVVGVVPPLAGMLAVVNTWSLPTVGGLAFLTLALAPADPVTLLPDRVATRIDEATDARWQDELGRHLVALGGAALVVALGVLWSLPFWLESGSARSVGFFPDRSAMTALLTVHGVFVLVFALHLVRHAAPYLERDTAWEAALMLAVGVALAWMGASAAALAVFGPLVLVAWVLLRVQADALSGATARAADTVREAVPDGGTATADASATGAEATGGKPGSSAGGVRDLLGYETVLLVAGAGIVVLVEFVYVKEQAGPERLNTVFKSYMDVWILWGVGAGAALAHLVENHAPSLALSGPDWRRGFRVLAAVLVFTTSIYGAMALTTHLGGDSYYNANAHPDNPTLDGFSYLQEDRPAELQAIHWFDDLEGQPNIVEAPGTDMYGSDDAGAPSSIISSLTGVPTLAGWAHEYGYRGDVYYDRVEDVNTIYTGSPGQRAFLLDFYDVEYVYVGTGEQAEYTDSELAVFDSMAGVTLVEQWSADFDTVRVYRVDQERLNNPAD